MTVNVWTIAEQIMMLLIIASIGVLLRRIGVMTEPVIKGTNRILMQVAWPAMIFMTTQKDCTDENTAGFLLLLVFSFAVFTVFCVLFTLLSGSGGKNRSGAVFSFLSVLPNAGFIGLPIVQAAYGDVGALYLAAVIVGFNFFVWTVGVFLFTDISVKSLKGALNPGFIACVIGTVLFFCKIRLPAPLLATSTQLGQTTTPLSMLLLGARLNRISAPMLKKPKLWIGCAVKLLIMPILTLLLMKCFQVPDVMVTGVAVLSMAMPSPAAAQLFAEKYEADIDLAVAGVSCSTLLCCVTIPCIVLLMGAL